MTTFDESIKQFNKPIYTDPVYSEKMREFHNRMYSFLWFMKNYMEGKNIDGTYIDPLQTDIKPIEDYYNLVSEDGKNDTPSTTTTFFFQKFYNKEYKDGHRMNIPTEAQKKEIDSWIINSIGDNGKINTNTLFKILHIDSTHYTKFVKNGDVRDTKVKVYEDSRELDNTGDIGRAASDMILYSKKYIYNNYDGYNKSNFISTPQDIDRIILETSIYKLKLAYTGFNQLVEKTNSYTSDSYNNGNHNLNIYSIVTSYPINNMGEITINRYTNPYDSHDALKNNLVFLVNDIPSLLGLNSSFEAGAIYVFDPKLALLIQEPTLQINNKKFNMWKSPYYTTIDDKDLNEVAKGIRITILTLQKYAAIRRYMWSKDPDYASEVYKRDPKDIINELRDPYSLLPYTYEHIREFTKYQSIKIDPRYVSKLIELTLIPYSIFADYPSLYLKGFNDMFEYDRFKIGLEKIIEERTSENELKELDTSIGKLEKEIPRLEKEEIPRLEKEIPRLENEIKLLEEEIPQLQNEQNKLTNTRKRLGPESIKTMTNKIKDRLHPSESRKLDNNINDVIVKKQKKQRELANKNIKLLKKTTEIAKKEGKLKIKQDELSANISKKENLLEKLERKRSEKYTQELDNIKKLYNIVLNYKGKQRIDLLKNELTKEMLKQLNLKEQINEEIISNWKWATKESKSIDKIYEELDTLIPHTSGWTLNRPYQDIEKIEIKRIPEVAKIFAPLIDRKERDNIDENISAKNLQSQNSGILSDFSPNAKEATRQMLSEEIKIRDAIYGIEHKGYGKLFGRTVRRGAKRFKNFFEIGNANVAAKSKVDTLKDLKDQYCKTSIGMKDNKNCGTIFQRLKRLYDTIINLNDNIQQKRNLHDILSKDIQKKIKETLTKNDLKSIFNTDIIKDIIDEKYKNIKNNIDTYLSTTRENMTALANTIHAGGGSINIKNLTELNEILSANIRTIIDSSLNKNNIDTLNSVLSENIRTIIVKSLNTQLDDILSKNIENTENLQNVLFTSITTFIDTSLFINIQNIIDNSLNIQNITNLNTILSKYIKMIINNFNDFYTKPEGDFDEIPQEFSNIKTPGIYKSFAGNRAENQINTFNTNLINIIDYAINIPLTARDKMNNVLNQQIIQSLMNKLLENIKSIIYNNLNDIEEMKNELLKNTEKIKRYIEIYNDNIDTQELLHSSRFSTVLPSPSDVLFVKVEWNDTNKTLTDAIINTPASKKYQLYDLSTEFKIPAPKSEGVLTRTFKKQPKSRTLLKNASKETLFESQSSLNPIEQ